VILGVDPGYAKCGWSVVEPMSGRVRALGVIVTTQDPNVAKKKVAQSTDRMRRIADVGAILHARAVQYGCTTIAAEQALQHGAAAAIAANLLPWGALTMLATIAGMELLEVTAKTWQHAVLGVEAGKVDYDELEAMLSGYVDCQVDGGLAAIKKALRTHAIDGVGVGMLAALRPHLATTIVHARAFPVELRKEATT
jgi:Holliday junction resolvasome RuvABC endonuclease subunit